MPSSRPVIISISPDTYPVALLRRLDDDDDDDDVYVADREEDEVESDARRATDTRVENIEHFQARYRFAFFPFFSFSLLLCFLFSFVINYAATRYALLAYKGARLVQTRWKERKRERERSAYHHETIIHFASPEPVAVRSCIEFVNRRYIISSA